MPKWSITIQISYSNKGNTDWSGNAVCRVYYIPYSTSEPVGISTMQITIPAGGSIVVNHTVNTTVDIPGRSQIIVDTYLEDPNTGAVFNYKRGIFVLPDANLITEGEVSMVSASII